MRSVAPIARNVLSLSFISGTDGSGDEPEGSQCIDTHGSATGQLEQGICLERKLSSQIPFQTLI